MSNNHNDNVKVSVIHLIWLPLGIESFYSFIDSYLLYPAGYAHELVLLFNGVDKEDQLAPYLDYISSKGETFKKIILNNGQDIEAYALAAAKLDSELILFL